MYDHFLIHSPLKHTHIDGLVHGVTAQNRVFFIFKAVRDSWPGWFECGAWAQGACPIPLLFDFVLLSPQQPATSEPIVFHGGGWGLGRYGNYHFYVIYVLETSRILTKIVCNLEPCCTFNLFLEPQDPPRCSAWQLSSDRITA